LTPSFLFPRTVRLPVISFFCFFEKSSGCSYPFFFPGSPVLVFFPCFSCFPPFPLPAIAVFPLAPLIPSFCRHQNRLHCPIFCHSPPQSHQRSRPTPCRGCGRVRAILFMTASSFRSLSPSAAFLPRIPSLLYVLHDQFFPLSPALFPGARFTRSISLGPQVFR